MWQGLPRPDVVLYHGVIVMDTSPIQGHESSKQSMNIDYIFRQWLRTLPYDLATSSGKDYTRSFSCIGRMVLSIMIKSATERTCRYYLLDYGITDLSVMHYLQGHLQITLNECLRTRSLCDQVWGRPLLERPVLHITMTSSWARWCLKSPVSRLFTHRLFRRQSKKISNLCVTGPCVPHTNGQ